MEFQRIGRFKTVQQFREYLNQVAPEFPCDEQVFSATEGSPLSAAFQGMEGNLAVVWGGEDFISLVKEVDRLHKDREYEQFEARGGVMDGEQLSADRIAEISKWPNRQEQLSLLSGQILAPGANLSAQLLGPGGALASQVQEKSEAEAEAEE